MALTKLTTNLNDPLIRFILNELYLHGADIDITYNAKPHIGTDVLRKVIKNIRNEIISLGGKFYFDTLFTDYKYVKDNILVSAKRDNEVGLLFEICELMPIYLIIEGLFRRCPICGKRKLTTWVRCGGSRYTLYDADCRNCKSRMGIEHDRDLHKWTYFHKKCCLDTTRINPIWETEKG